MSAKLSFLPWARVGIGRALTAQAGALRAQMPIKVQVDGQIGTERAPAEPVPAFRAELLGPGDVLGIDPRVIIRAEPGAYAQGAPARTLVAIEFSRPDFPWMFSPLVPDAQQRLLPWVCLLVVPQRPGISLRPRGDGTLPVLTVDSGSELPDLAEAWAWAHVQVLTDDGQPPDLTVGAGDERSLSRLISPRRLEPGATYYACLVPTFNAGRQVGLDPAAEPAGPLRPAWTGAIPPDFQLPVYHWWTFSTGAAGDFQDLVEKLKPQKLPREVGWRPITIDFPTATLPEGFNAFTAPLEGVLRGVHNPPGVSDPGAANEVKRELKRLIGLTGTVGPPRYGQAQATAGAPWLSELNGAPTARVAAATGARVVQAQQEQLIASAWEQVGEMQRANQQRRQAKVAVIVGEALMFRHLAAMTADRVLQVTAPARIPISAGIPPAALSGTFRRLQRRTGSLARRTAGVSAEPLLADIALAPPPAPLQSAMGVIDWALLQQLAPYFVSQKNAAVLPFSDDDAEPRGRTSSAVATFTFSGTRIAFPRTSNPPPVHVRAASVPWRLDDESQFVTDAEPAALARRQATAKNFKTAALSVQNYLFGKVLPSANTMVVFSQPLPDGSAVAHTRVLDALRPARTLVARVVAATVTASSESPGPSMLAAFRYDPIFPQGMYCALADLAPDMFLIGADHVPDNSVGRVRVNPRFIEAYLAGLNHEMGRELVWRGFPSDGRGTYFRRFWETDAYPALSVWRGALGANAPQRDWVVLLIRGEIVRRYPRAVIFAQRGSLDSSGARFVPASEPRRYPLFRVTLGGDLLCVGFDVTAAEAHGHFFGIEEQITEPRFAPPAIPAGPYLRLAELPLGPGVHAGQVAAATLRRPVRVIIDPHLLIT